MYVNRLVLAAAIAGATPAAAKQTFAPYEGLAAVQAGTGGTKITKNGIDYWTTGAPPRRYQILGILTDARKDRLADGNVLGSKSVAEKTKAAGGDAVLFQSSDAQAAGIAASGNFARMVTRTTTQLTVIKYLQPE